MILGNNLVYLCFVDVLLYIYLAIFCMYFDLKMVFSKIYSKPMN